MTCTRVTVRTDVEDTGEGVEAVLEGWDAGTLTDTQVITRRTQSFQFFKTIEKKKAGHVQNFKIALNTILTST